MARRARKYENEHMGFWKYNLKNKTMTFSENLCNFYEEEIINESAYSEKFKLIQEATISPTANVMKDALNDEFKEKTKFRISTSKGIKSLIAYPPNMICDKYGDPSDLIGKIVDVTNYSR